MKTIFTLLFFVLFISQCYCAIELLDFDGELKGEYSTIQEAVNAISEAGDQVVIPGGHYYEVVDVSNKDFGTEDKPIIIKAKDSETVIIDGAYQPLTESGNGLWGNSDVFGSGYYMADFSEKECPSNYYAYATFSPPDQRLLWTYGSEENMEEFFAGQGVYYDSTTEYVHIKLKDDEDPNDVELYINCKWTLQISNCHHLTVSDIDVRNGRRALIISKSLNTKIDSCDIWGYLNGISVRYDSTNYTTISNNLVVQNRDPDWWWSDVKSIYPKTMESSAISISAGIHNTIANNEVKGWFNGIIAYNPTETNNYYLKIYQNTIHDIYDDALEPELYCKNVEIYNNIVYDSFVAISIAPCEGPMYVYRNILISDKKIIYNKEDNKTGNPYTVKLNSAQDYTPTKIYFYHNTVFSDGAAYSGATEDYKNFDHQWYNNIFYSTGKIQTTLMYRSGLKSDGIDWNGNLYYIDVEPGTVNYFKYFNSYTDDTRYYSLEEALAGNGKGTGWETDGISGEDPLFTDLEALPIQDFTLQKKSPAIDAAVEVPYIFPDISKKCGDKFDIGAYEYTGNNDCEDDDDDTIAGSFSLQSHCFVFISYIIFFLFF